LTDWSVGSYFSSVPVSQIARVAASKELLDQFEQMSVIRFLENLAERLNRSGETTGPFHSSAGQEAIAVGICAALRPDDYVWASYRGHHHFIAKGGSAEACLGELLGRDTGACRGLGGSMHLTDVAHNMMGSYAIVGAQIAMACGSAWSALLRGTDQVSIAFFGDGATNIGVFHESLNLAAVGKLPVVFVCENNLYMEYTLTADVTSVSRPAADRATANGVPSVVIDGNDLQKVTAAAADAVGRARAGAGPTVIEALTYRHGGHAASDLAGYRPPGELETWLERDPLTRATRRLHEMGVDAEEIEAASLRARHTVERAHAAALAALPARADLAITGVWADGGAAWRN
jgi:acetoin:2,6-dichlorophenolindophenol oxidoreductase subunit alpha